MATLLEVEPYLLHPLSLHWWLMGIPPCHYFYISHSYFVSSHLLVFVSCSSELDTTYAFAFLFAASSDATTKANAAQ